ncbi:MAG: monovalent cation/H+ antiporter subunit D family protein [Candidatus Dadabacteria bacterium]|nr:MAG: monovalent cation/H+ antiporter subunit D family protein [Candidatus Dadabacteria bacterium]
MENMLLLTVILLPLLLTACVIILSRRPRARNAITLIVSILVTLLVFFICDRFGGSAAERISLFQLLPGIDLAFRIDSAGLLLAAVSSFLWPITNIYSIGYLEESGSAGSTRYFACFSLSIFATLGVAFAANLVTLYIFYELLSLATFPLVGHRKHIDSQKACRVYTGYLLGSSLLLLLPAIVLTYIFAGSVDFSPGGILKGTASGPVLVLLLLMFMFGVAKGALMPLHVWLPSAMVAPTPVSALLHAVAVVKVGVFSQFRILSSIFGFTLLKSISLAGFSGQQILIVLTVITMVAADILALSQNVIKRILAYSTIGQLAYITLAFSVAAPYSVAAGLMHIAFHAFGKITLFLCAGAIFIACGAKQVNEIRGIAWKMPVTMSCFAVGALSIVGLPPASGFISKWYLLLGAFSHGFHFVFYAVIISTVLKAFYLLRILVIACSREHTDCVERACEQGRIVLCVAPVAITAILVVVTFFFSEMFFELAKLAVSQIQGL